MQIANLAACGRSPAETPGHRCRRFDMPIDELRYASTVRGINTFHALTEDAS